MKKKPQSKEKKRSALGWVWNTITTLLMVAVLFLVVVVRVIPSIMGGASLTVLTQSMQPGLNPGDMVAVVPTEHSQINIGDVITFHPFPDDPTKITHRVVGKKVGGPEGVTFITKGDNNSEADRAPVYGKQVAGKVIYAIPYVGWIGHSTPGGNQNLVLYAAIALFALGGFWIVSGFVSDIRDKRRNKNKPDKQEVEEEEGGSE